jgi:hypothetical protein
MFQIFESGGCWWKCEHYATVVRMVIETTTHMKYVPLQIDYTQPETRVLSHMRKPLPQMRVRMRHRGERIMISRSTGANQVTFFIIVVGWGEKKVNYHSYFTRRSLCAYCQT